MLTQSESSGLPPLTLKAILQAINSWRALVVKKHLENMNDTDISEQAHVFPEAQPLFELTDELLNKLVQAGDREQLLYIGYRLLSQLPLNADIEPIIARGKDPHNCTPPRLKYVLMNDDLKKIYSWWNWVKPSYSLEEIAESIRQVRDHHDVSHIIRHSYPPIMVSGKKKKYISYDQEPKIGELRVSWGSKGKPEDLVYFSHGGGSNHIKEILSGESKGVPLDTTNKAYGLWVSPTLSEDPKKKNSFYQQGVGYTSRCIDYGDQPAVLTGYIQKKYLLKVKNGNEAGIPHCYIPMIQDPVVQPWHEALKKHTQNNELINSNQDIMKPTWRP